MLWIVACLALAAVAQLSGAECDLKTFKIKGGQAYFINGEMADSLQAANSICEKYDGTLASITSDKQYRKIKAKLEELNPGYESFAINAVYSNEIGWAYKTDILFEDLEDNTGTIFPEKDPVAPEGQLVAVIVIDQTQLVERDLKKDPSNVLCQMPNYPASDLDPNLLQKEALTLK